MKETSKGVLFASSTALLWGILPFLLMPVLRQVEVINVIWFRFLFSFLTLLGLLLYQRRIRWRQVLTFKPSVWLAGVFLSLNYFGFSYGLSLTNPSSAQILIQVGPISFAVLSFFLFREHLNPAQWAGVLLALLGFGLFWKDQMAHLLAELHSYRWGVVWICVGGFSWGLYALCLKRAGQWHRPQEINLGIYLISLLLYAPLIHPRAFRNADALGWPLLIATGVNTVFAYGSLSESVRRISAAKVSLIICLNPLLTLALVQIALVAGITWPGQEELHLGSWLGAACVVGGAVLVVSGRESAPKRTRWM